jgi:hypothetical protein
MGCAASCAASMGCGPDSWLPPEQLNRKLFIAAMQGLDSVGACVDGDREREIQVKKLLAAGADPNAPEPADFGEYVCHFACRDRVRVLGRCTPLTTRCTATRCSKSTPSSAGPASTGTRRPRKHCWMRGRTPTSRTMYAVLAPRRSRCRPLTHRARTTAIVPRRTAAAPSTGLARRWNTAALPPLRSSYRCWRLRSPTPALLR